MRPFDPIKSATDMAKQVHVSSVLNPLLWSFPFQMAAVLVAAFIKNWLAEYFFVVTTGTTISVFLFCYVKVLFFGDPELLRSEDHIFRMKALEILGDDQHLLKDFIDSDVTNNPTMPSPSTSKIPETQKIEEDAGGEYVE